MSEARDEIYSFNANMAPDADYEPGELVHLVVRTVDPTDAVATRRGNPALIGLSRRFLATYGPSEMDDALASGYVTNHRSSGVERAQSG